MAVLNLKPHTLRYLIVSDGYEEENGDYHEGESLWSEISIPCDVVPAGKANEVAFEDGVVKTYSYIVYLSKDCIDFKLGDRIKICLFGETEREFEVKGFHRYQHQCKMWI